MRPRFPAATPTSSMAWHLVLAVGHQTHLRRSGSCLAGSPCLLSAAGSARHTWRCCHRPGGTQGPQGSTNRQPRPRGGRTHRRPSPVVTELEPQLPGRTRATDPTRLPQLGGGAGTPPSPPPRDRPGLGLLLQAERAGRQLPPHPTRKEGLSGKRGPGTKDLARVLPSPTAMRLKRQPPCTLTLGAAE